MKNITLKYSIMKCSILQNNVELYFSDRFLALHEMFYVHYKEVNFSDDYLIFRRLRMKKRVQILALAGILVQISIVPILEGKKLSTKEKVRSDNQLIKAESKEDKQRGALTKKTHEKLKAAREQYKKQLSRLIDLLSQADELGRGIEESEATTRDLKDFFGALGSMYTSVVDTITGAGDYKKRISDLEKSNTQLLALIQVLKSQLDQRDQQVKQLQITLESEKNKSSLSIQRAAQLEKEKLLWLDYLSDLESCAIAMKEGKNKSENASQLVGQMLASAYQSVLNASMPKN
jgi:DNA repair exonuclease SbcCD ATPase subunit